MFNIPLICSKHASDADTFLICSMPFMASPMGMRMEKKLCKLKLQNMIDWMNMYNCGYQNWNKIFFSNKQFLKGSC
jgi:hypothetical protein